MPSQHQPAPLRLDSMPTIATAAAAAGDEGLTPYRNRLAMAAKRKQTLFLPIPPPIPPIPAKKFKK